MNLVTKNVCVLLSQNSTSVLLIEVRYMLAGPDVLQLPQFAWSCLLSISTLKHTYSIPHGPEHPFTDCYTAHLHFMTLIPESCRCNLVAVMIHGICMTLEKGSMQWATYAKIQKTSILREIESPGFMGFKYLSEQRGNFSHKPTATSRAHVPEKLRER